MQTDPLADFLTTIRNAARASKSEVRVPWSRMRSDVAHILKNQGYVLEVEKVSDKETEGKPVLRLKLRGSGKSRSITQITRISKPGRRVYSRSVDLKPILGGLGISVISTSRGVISDREARQRKLGGEVLCEIY